MRDIREVEGGVSSASRRVNGGEGSHSREIGKD